MDNRWVPNEESVKKEYSIIESCYRGRNVKREIPEDYKPMAWEFAKISVFLQDEAVVLAQLRKLNSLLEKEATKRNLIISENDLTHKKVLRNVLEQELEKMGFQPDFAKATGFLPPDVFRSTIRDGLLIKDPGAGIEHGEFTHAIQWLVIGWQQQDTPFLKYPVIEVFKQLGDDRSVLGITRINETNMWDLIVDDLRHKDCRNPDYLHQVILESEDPNLSLLKKLCGSRMTKRKTKASNLFHEEKEFPKKEYDQSKDHKDLLIARKKP